MEAVKRLAIGFAAAASMIAAVAPARAQEAPPANEAEPERIGPRELQDFNLQGTVTRPAEPPAQQPAPTPAPAQRPSQVAPPPAGQQEAPRVSEAGRLQPAAPATVGRPEQRTLTPAAPAPAAERPTARSVTMKLPPIGDSPSAGSPGPADAPARGLPWMWVLAGLAMLGGAGAYFWRIRQRAALAGAAGIDDLVAAEPAPRTQPPAPPLSRPTPQPRPDALQPAPSPEPLGLVSTRMRPWLELAFKPLSCVIDGDNLVIQFELGLFNSGNSPARAILVEASFFNAGPTQDQEIERFFANPVGQGGRAISLGPLKRMTIRNQLVTPLASIREFDVGGRKVFVPLIGFNALYRWASGKGQTSASFMLGRETGRDKLAPFRLDVAAREFRAVGERPLPAAVRA